jgi:putative hydrolase of the HAD superfamily
MIKWIVWDLDDTLLDTTGLLLPIAKTPQYFERIRQKLPLIEGAAENLYYLAKKYHMALLTQGNTEVQKTKMKSMGIEQFFQELFFADLEKSENKGTYFAKLVSQENLNNGEFLSIGNRQSTDIREAKQAGGKTCLYLYGEHLHESLDKNNEPPDFKISHHRELIPTCNL